MKIVLTNGCFDGFHYGHLRFLEHARELGDKLIVLVDTDKSLISVKGNRLLMPFEQRIAIISALKCVDETYPFEGVNDIVRRIEVLKPNIYVKGDEYTRRTLLPPELPQILDNLKTEIVFLPMDDIKFRKILGIIKSLKQVFES